jgi:hypothetical protein
MAFPFRQHDNLVEKDAELDRLHPRNAGGGNVGPRKSLAQVVEERIGQDLLSDPVRRPDEDPSRSASAAHDR